MAADTPAETRSGETKRSRYERLRTQLEEQRAPVLNDWRDINDYILPGRARFNTSDINQRRSRKKIIDSTGTQAAHILGSGFMGAVTSPAREWKELTVPEDPELAKWGPVKGWLYRVAEIMSEIHRSCGVYKTLPVVYKDFGGFATGAMIVDEDLTGGRVMRTHPFAPGSYMIANDERNRVSVFMRVFQMTVRQIVGKFAAKNLKGDYDFSNISVCVQNHWKNNNYEVLVEVCHVVHPNDEYSPIMLLSKYKKFKSCYYETGSVSGSSQGNYMNDAAGAGEDRYLSEKGYDYFPILAPRWALTDGDSYGTDCPGMTAIGDVKSLQIREKMIARGEEKGINPAMVASPALRNVKASTLPGDITYDPSPADKTMRAAHDINFRLDFSENKQAVTRARINEVFFKNLFLSISNDARNERATAYEIAAKKDEEFRALAPVMENVNDDLLDPFVDITFAMMLEQRRVPEPPKELQGRRLGVRYISIMAQAQKSLGLGGVERFLNIAGAIGTQTGDPRLVTRKVNVNRTIDVVGEMTGIPAGIVRTDEEAEAIEQQQMAVEQEAQRSAQLAEQAKAARDLGSVKTDQPNVLTDLVKAAGAGQEAN